MSTHTAGDTSQSTLQHLAVASAVSSPTLVILSKQLGETEEKHKVNSEEQEKHLPCKE